MIQKISSNSFLSFKILGQGFLFQNEDRGCDNTWYWWAIYIYSIRENFALFQKDFDQRLTRQHLQWKILILLWEMPFSNAHSNISFFLFFFFNLCLAAGLDLFQGDILLRVSTCQGHSNIPQNWLFFMTGRLCFVQPCARHCGGHERI